MNKAQRLVDVGVPVANTQHKIIGVLMAQLKPSKSLILAALSGCFTAGSSILRDFYVINRNAMSFHDERDTTTMYLSEIGFSTLLTAEESGPSAPFCSRR